MKTVCHLFEPYFRLPAAPWDREERGHYRLNSIVKTSNLRKLWHTEQPVANGHYYYVPDDPTKPASFAVNVDYYNTWYVEWCPARECWILVSDSAHGYEYWYPEQKTLRKPLWRPGFMEFLSTLIGNRVTCTIKEAYIAFLATQWRL